MQEAMPTGSELLRRVNEAMSGTIQEQLRELVVAARTGIEQFSDAAAQQGTLLADAHAGIVDAQERLATAMNDARSQLSDELRMGMDEASRAREADKDALESVAASLAQRVVAMDASVTDAMDILRSDVESMHAASEQRAVEAFTSFVARTGSQMSEIERDLHRRSQEMHDGFVERAAALEAALERSVARSENAGAAITSRIEFVERGMKDVRDQIEQTALENIMRFEQIMKKLEDTSGIEERAAHLVSLLRTALGTIDPGNAEVRSDPQTLSA